MQLAKSGSAAHNNPSPEMRARPAQNDAKLMRVNLLI